MTLFKSRMALAGAILIFCCLNIASMIACGLVFPTMNVWKSDSPSSQAIIGTAVMASFIPAFVVARFSFGYLVALPLFSTILGFVWLSFFSKFEYPHALARWSMITALAAAIAPLLFLNIDVWRPPMTKPSESRLIIALACAGVITLVICVSYGVAFGDPYGTARDAVSRPVWLNYLSGIIVAAVIPYLFAQSIRKKRLIGSVGVIVLTLGFYPVALNKTVLFMPAWMVFLAWIFGRFEDRLASVLALLVPTLIGLMDFASILIFPQHHFVAFGAINLRLIAVPSLALDHYADFFTHHDLTKFCQISIIRKMIGCHYGEIGPALSAVYKNGNFNASFLASEGIASVGFILTPIVALLAGALLSMGSMVSSHLSPRFIAISSSIAILSIMNVPLGTALLSNGVATLFLLWWITPPEPTQ